MLSALSIYIYIPLLNHYTISATVLVFIDEWTGEPVIKLPSGDLFDPLKTDIQTLQLPPELKAQATVLEQRIRHERYKKEIAAKKSSTQPSGEEVSDPSASDIASVIHSLAGKSRDRDNDPEVQLPLEVDGGIKGGQGIPDTTDNNGNTGEGGKERVRSTPYGAVRPDGALPGSPSLEVNELSSRQKQNLRGLSPPLAFRTSTRMPPEPLPDTIKLEGQGVRPVSNKSLREKMEERRQVELYSR